MTWQPTILASEGWTGPCSLSWTVPRFGHYFLGLDTIFNILQNVGVGLSNTRSQFITHISKYTPSQLKHFIL